MANLKNVSRLYRVFPTEGYAGRAEIPGDGSMGFCSQCGLRGGGGSVRIIINFLNAYQATPLLFIRVFNEENIFSFSGRAPWLSAPL